MARTDTAGVRGTATEMDTVGMRRRGARGPAGEMDTMITMMADNTDIETRVTRGARAHCDG